MNAPVLQFDKHTKAAFIAACLTLLIFGFGFYGVVQALNVYLKKEPVPLRVPFSLIPTQLGKWKAIGPDRELDASIVESLGTKISLDRTYGLEGGSSSDALKVHLAYYTGMIDTVPHVPDRCFVASGLDPKSLPENLPLSVDRQAWVPDPEQLVSLAADEVYSVVWLRDVAGRVVAVRMPTGDLKLRTLEFGEEKHPDWRIFGGYFFIANNRITPTPEGVKMMAFDPREKYAYFCKVQYVYIARDGTQEKFLSLVADHMKDFLPELMRCLPDWAEVERRDQKTAASPPASE